MHDKMVGYTFAFVSAVGLGVTNFLFTRSAKALGSVNTTFYYYVFALVIGMACWLPFSENREFNISELKWPAFIAIAMFISNLTYSYAVRYFDTSTPAIIRSVSFFITGLIAISFNREHLTLKDWLAFLLVASGIFLFGYGRHLVK
jgi:drug/metabolite transporter (DMT)-like permease